MTATSHAEAERRMQGLAAAIAVAKARYVAEGVAGNHDRGRAAWRAAQAALRAAARDGDLAAHGEAFAAVCALWALVAYSVRIGVESRVDWLIRHSAIRRMVRAARPFVSASLDVGESEANAHARAERRAVDAFSRVDRAAHPWWRPGLEEEAIPRLAAELVRVSHAARTPASTPPAAGGSASGSIRRRRAPARHEPVGGTPLWRRRARPVVALGGVL